MMQIILKQTRKQTNEVLGWLSRIMGLTRVLGVVLFFVQLHIPGQAAGQSITLAWNRSTDTNVASYNVYYGVASHVYTSMIPVGNVTNATVSGLVAGATYYFAATAYDPLGGQSAYSNEASYVVPTLLSKLQIRSAPAGQFILTVTGEIGSQYEILATQNFTVWTVIGMVTLGPSGSLDFTDTTAANFSNRFYRTQENP
jgi:hypothetical protein